MENDPKMIQYAVAYTDSLFGSLSRETKGSAIWEAYPTKRDADSESMSIG